MFIKDFTTFFGVLQEFPEASQTNWEPRSMEMCFRNVWQFCFLSTSSVSSRAKKIRTLQMHPVTQNGQENWQNWRRRKRSKRTEFADSYHQSISERKWAQAKGPPMENHCQNNLWPFLPRPRTKTKSQKLFDSTSSWKW